MKHFQSIFWRAYTVGTPTEINFGFTLLLAGALILVSITLARNAMTACRVSAGKECYTDNKAWLCFTHERNPFRNTWHG